MTAAAAGASPVIVITGASSGIGRAAAVGFASSGADLVLAARGGPALAEVAAQCRAAGARSATVVPTDVADPAAVEHLAATALERAGRIDVWVNAASVLSAADPLEEPVDTVRAVIDVDLLGTIHGSRAALRAFTAQGSGTLVNVGSLLGLLPNPLLTSYVTAKFGVRGLTLSLRQAMASYRDVHVCLVLPGPVDTPMFSRAANRTGRRLRAIAPATAPDRVAAAVIRCVGRPRRQVTVGVTGALMVLGSRVAPGATEAIVGRASARLLVTDERAAPSGGAVSGDGAGGTVTPAAQPHAVQGGWRDGAVRRRLGDRLGRVQQAKAVEDLPWDS